MTDGRVVVGVDIGGTFTDVMLHAPARGLAASGKLLTRHGDLTRCVIDGLGDVLTRHGLSLGDVDAVVHATTLASNAIIERKGARTGLLVTDGFRDLLEAGTGQPYDIYDLFLSYPPPLVPRALVREIPERVSAAGETLAALDEDAAAAAVGELADLGVEAIAVVFLHSYREPAHERSVAALARRARPGVDVSLSADVSPEFREYERASTTVANAYVRPLVSDYLRGLARALRDAGFGGRFYVMLSSGGMALPSVASEHPVRMVESGPAAGVLGAADYGALIGERNLLSFDMGGTTAKVCLVRDGEISRTSTMEVARQHRFKAGSGLPLRAPALELLEVGSGGGSIASVDDAGRLRVGPESAGSAPGPACYGLGGTRPTVTDACVVLGYYGAESFLGGTMRLDAAAAERVIGEAIAAPFGVGTAEAAWGIFALAAESMAAAARVHAAEKAVDPRVCSLLAFGGAGPAFGHRIARILGARRVVVPPRAGVGSTHGLVIAPLAFEFSQSQPQAVTSADWEGVRALVGDLRRQATGVLRDAGVEPERVDVRVWADMCLLGQSYEVTVPLEYRVVAEGDEAALTEAFEEVYEGRYGRRALGLPAQVLTWRVQAAERREPGARPRPEPAGAAHAPGERTRAAYFPEAGGYVDCQVVARDALTGGRPLRGPAIVEEYESTTVVGPEAEVALDGFGNLVVALDAARARE